MLTDVLGEEKKRTKKKRNGKLIGMEGRGKVGVRN